MIRRYTILIIVAFLAWTSTVQANGRFPKTTNVHIQPNDDNVILLPATFGLLISRDAGASFHWVCEEAIGYGGSFDPDYAIAQDGAIFATTFDGLRVSRDGGCLWENAGNLSPEEYFAEVEIGPNGYVWAATASAAMMNRVYLSTDNGMSFEPKDAGLPQVWWKTLRISESNPQRIYLSGYRVAETLADGGLVPPQGILYRSDDGGDTWLELDLDEIEFGSQPWFLIEGVDPDDPDTVFARAQGANGAIGDVLYRSTDAGETWVRVLASEVQMQAFLIRKSGTIVVGTLTDGVHSSTNGGDTWERENLPQMCCLDEDSGGTLYACGANWDPDFFALGTSQDLMNWEKTVRFSEIAGAYSCPVGTIQRDTCETKRWPALCEMFGCNRVFDAAPAIDAPPTGNGGGGGGCCDASGQLAWGNVVLVGLVCAWLLTAGRRRRVRVIVRGICGDESR